MKKLLYFAAVVIAATASVSTATSCKFAPSQNDGDTVAASEFYPEDTSALHAKKMARIKAQKAMTDSVGIYYIGSGSSKENYNWFPILQDETPLNTERLAASRLRVALISTTWYVSISISSMAKTRS